MEGEEFNENFSTTFSSLFNPQFENVLFTLDG